jgi:hypothetical protein
MLEDDLVDEVLGAIQNATVPTGWNDNTIVMIPNVGYQQNRIPHFHRKNHPPRQYYGP